MELRSVKLAALIPATQDHPSVDIRSKNATPRLRVSKESATPSVKAKASQQTLNAYPPETSDATVKSILAVSWR
ncbi:hypothetical protein NX059_009872 [Plenodomus lindquistii]|nr:hypothetical protein NX059_009872 [Plenodomus lindquistii]